MKRGEIYDLDTYVLGALDLFTKVKIPEFIAGNSRILVVGSGNAEVVGRILFHDKNAVFANESNYLEKIKHAKYSSAVLVSASGGKHAPKIAKDLKKRKIKVSLFTNTQNSSAEKYCYKTFVFPKNEEPYTYNTSTYMGMLLSKTKENPKKIRKFLEKMKVPSFKGYKSFFIVLPEKFGELKGMFQTKFDELFGPKIQARIYTYEQVKHAKTVVSDDKEFFIGLGVKNKVFGKKRANFTVPSSFGYTGMLSIGYYLIGKIQKDNPPYFKKNIDNYVKKASKVFKEKIKVFS